MFACCGTVSALLPSPLVCLVSLAFGVLLFRTLTPISRSSRRHQKGRSTPSRAVLTLLIWLLFTLALHFSYWLLPFIGENIQGKKTGEGGSSQQTVSPYRAHGSRPCPLSPARGPATKTQCLSSLDTLPSHALL